MDDPKRWLCVNCGHTGFSGDAAPASATPEELVDSDVLWCDGCGATEYRVG